MREVRPEQPKKRRAEQDARGNLGDDVRLREPAHQHTQQLAGGENDDELQDELQCQTFWCHESFALRATRKQALDGTHCAHLGQSRTVDAQRLPQGRADAAGKWLLGTSEDVSVHHRKIFGASRPVSRDGRSPRSVFRIP